MDTLAAEFDSVGSLRVRPGLRVLQVIDGDPYNYPPTLNAARVLAEAGARVVCLGGLRTDLPAVQLPPGAEVRIASFGRSGTPVEKVIWGVGRLRFRRAVCQAAKRMQADLVIAYDTGAGWAVLPLTGSRTRRTIFHVHDNEIPPADSWTSIRNWQWRSLRRLTGQFTKLVVPEAARGEDLHTTWGIGRDYDVVANAPPRATRSRNCELKDQLKLPPDTPLAVVVGNIGLLDELAAGLARTQAEWHLAIVGARAPRAISAMLEVARNHGIEQRIHLIGYTSYETVRSWLPGCDVGVATYPSSAHANWRLMGTASVKLMEYMAAGIPTIVAPQPSHVSLARSTGALEVLGEESADAFGFALDRLLPSGEHACRLAAAALSAHLNTYNAEAQLAPILRDLGLDR